MVVLRDALYNTHVASGSSVDYGRAIVVGVVAGMMSSGKTWHEAWEEMYKALPAGFRRDCIPHNWECYVIVLHRPTGQQYILNRNYHCITPKPVRDFLMEGRVEVWEGYSVTGTPEWARAFPTNEFTGYWMY